MSYSIRALPGRTPPARMMAIGASACGHVTRSFHQCTPPFLYVAAFPDRDGDHPGEDEHGGDRVPERAEVEAVQPVPHAAAERELVRHHLQNLDGADRERRGHREGSDRDVVVDAPD